MVNSPRGRRRGKPDTRAALVAAARTEFLDRGYAKASARSIATRAGVDHAMVNYYFGSKRGLFTAAMSLVISPRMVLDAVLENRGEEGSPDLAHRLAATFIAIWGQESFREPMLALVRQAAVDEHMRAALGEYIGSEILSRVGDAIGGAGGGAGLRARIAGVEAVLMGTLMARYVYRVEPIASMPRDRMVDVIASMLAVPLRRR